MKKKYWQRLILIAIEGIILMILYVGPCNYNTARCLGGDSILFTRTLFHIVLSLLIVSLFSLFISDAIIKKWLKFSLVWFIIDAILIALAPVSSGGAIVSGPTKESVSIWMGSLFVIISLRMFVVLTIREKNTQK